MQAPGTAEEAGLRSVSRLRLLQLVSPAWPVGAFAYSRGLEQAVERGWVADGESLESWLQGVLQYSLARTDLPLIIRASNAWSAGALETELDQLNTLSIAFRETKELRDEELHLGRALARLLQHLGMTEAHRYVADTEVSYVFLFGLAAARWHIDAREALEGYAFSWAENQLAAASRLMPLGQLQAQACLSSLLPAIEAAVDSAFRLRDAELGQTAPALALASSWHEQQYSRLFRS